MKILIKRGSDMGGYFDEPPKSERDKLFIYFAFPEAEMAHGFEIDFERIKNLKPGEEIKG